MAAKQRKRKMGKFAYVHKFAALVGLLTFVVVIVAGIKGQVSVNAIVFRACMAMLLIAVIGRFIIRIMNTYEEMNRGQG